MNTIERVHEGMGRYILTLPGVNFGGLYCMLFLHILQLGYPQLSEKIMGKILKTHKQAKPIAISLHKKLH
ncbi:MAG: hypothetical protein AAF320_03315 [Myxococcota bacterium]